MSKFIGDAAEADAMVHSIASADIDYALKQLAFIKAMATKATIIVDACNRAEDALNRVKAVCDVK